MNWQGKNKAFTLSFDDGIEQDKRFIKLLDKYGLKSTFNLNSQLMGLKGELKSNEICVGHNKIASNEIKATYINHEVAVHTLTHPNLTQLTDNEIIRQVNFDKENLEQLVGYSITCMAYPCGGVNNNNHVAKLIKDNTQIKMCRTIKSTYSFDLQDNYFRFNPSVQFTDFDNLFKLANNFIKSKFDSPKLFYVWGHSYEFDMFDGWDKAEEFCALISNKADIYYGTNKDIFGF